MPPQLTGTKGAEVCLLPLSETGGLVLLCHTEIPAVVPAWKRESNGHGWQ